MPGRDGMTSWERDIRIRNSSIEITNALFGNTNSMTSQQFNNRCKAFYDYTKAIGTNVSDNTELADLLLDIYSRNAEIPPYTSILPEIQNWINTTSPTFLNYNFTNRIYNILTPALKSYIAGESEPSVLLSKIIYYLINNTNSTEAQLLQTIITFCNEAMGSNNLLYFDNLGNLINRVYDNLGNLINVNQEINNNQQNTQAFTNYVKKYNNYSRISVDNGSSMWHSRLSGSPFSPKV